MTSFPTWQQIFDNKEFVAAVLFAWSALIGQMFHAVKKSLEDDMDCIHWFRSDFRRSVAAMIGNFFGVVIFVQSGVVVDVFTGPHGGWWGVILFGLMNGFSADSALNKAQREQWTDEQRAARKKP